MAKQNWDKFESDLKKAIDKLASQDIMQQIGDKAAQIIKKRTRLGYGVQDVNKPKERLKPLSESYKKQRAGKVQFKTKSGTVVKFNTKKPELHEETRPTRSNLTKTGQMLDSMKANAKRGSVTISPTGSRKEGSLTNLKVAEYVSKDRPFNNLATDDIKQLRDFVAEILRLLTKYL